MENFQSEGAINTAQDSQDFIQDSFSQGSLPDNEQIQSPPLQAPDAGQIADNSFSDYFANIASKSLAAPAPQYQQYQYPQQYQQPVYNQPQYQQPAYTPPQAPAPVVQPQNQESTYNLDYDKVANYLDEGDVKGLFQEIENLTQHKAQSLFEQKQADLNKTVEQRVQEIFESKQQAEAFQQISTGVVQGLVKNNIVLNPIEAQIVEQQIVNTADTRYQEYIQSYNLLATTGQLDKVAIAKNPDGSPIGYNEFVINLGVGIAKEYKKGMNGNQQLGTPNNMVRQTMNPVVQAGSQSRVAGKPDWASMSDSDFAKYW